MTDDLKARGVRVTREEAQAQIDGLLVAEILMDFGTNFHGVYPDNVLARGVGPEQSMIGLAIKRGHLMVATPAALSDHPTVKQMVAEAVAAERSKMIIAVQRAFEHRRGLMSVAVASDKATAAIRGETT